MTPTPTLSSVTVTKAGGSGTSTSSSAAGNNLDRSQGLTSGLGVVPLLILAYQM
jgi:hypothetical protein